MSRALGMMAQPMLSPVAAREAVHLLVLRELTRVCGVDSATVKGGVNLRLFFGSVRYSEDIDLDRAATSSDAIRSCIKRIFRDRSRSTKARLLSSWTRTRGNGTARRAHGISCGSMRLR